MAKIDRNPDAARGSVYDQVTEQVVSLLEGGTVPWHKPWNPSTGLPLSMSTAKPYRGVNPFLLGVSSVAAGYESPWWGTYKQIEARGGQVRRGERSTFVIFWKVLRTADVIGHRADGSPIYKQIPMLKHFRVFNADQADGLDLPALAGPKPFLPIEACETIAAGYIAAGPAVTHADPTGAYYRPSTDTVNMPTRDAFTSAEGYYSTLFHELTHSTGHPTRLAREGITEGHRFGDETYSREELIAEMGAAMLCGVAGIEQTTIANSAAYLASWVRVLRGDHRLIVTAAAAAQRAADLVRGVDHTAGADEEPTTVDAAAA